MGPVHVKLLSRAWYVVTAQLASVVWSTPPGLLMLPPGSLDRQMFILSSKGWDDVQSLSHNFCGESFASIERVS